MKKVIIYILFHVSLSFAYSNTIDQGRLEYYKAVESEESIEKAEKIFKQLKKDKDMEAVSEIYLGSLTAMKAMYVLWPGTKLEYANEGIDQMEKALAKSPDNIESLFIYGTTCYYMPFFLGKSEDAEKALKKIIDLIPQSKDKYDSEVLENAILFILEELDLTKNEKKKLYGYLADLKE